MSENNKRELKRFEPSTIEAIINTNDQLMRENLKQIELDFRQQTQTNLDTARSMERLAVQDGRMLDAMRYRVMAQIYQQILDNYTLSNSYDKP